LQKDGPYMYKNSIHKKLIFSIFIKKIQIFIFTNKKMYSIEQL